MAYVLAHLKKIISADISEENMQIIEGVIPQTVRYPLADNKQALICPHSFDTLKLIRNLGGSTRGCELLRHYYTLPESNDRTPWWWQISTAAFLADNERAYVTSTPRTGKTLSTCMAIDFLQACGMSAALIVAPLTVAKGGEWSSAFADWFPNKKVVVVHSDREAQIMEPADVYVINPDGVKIIEELIAQRIASKRISIVAVDELTDFSNVQSAKWKAANRCLTGARFLWGITGFPGGCEKVYGQIKLITPRNVPSSFNQWRNRTMYKQGMYKWVPHAESEKIIGEAMQPSIRFDKAEVMDIPEPEVVAVKAELSKEQQRVYEELRVETQSMIGSNLVDASTATALSNKLLQVSGGCIKGEAGVTNIDMTPKLKALEELLRRTPAKKVVYSNYRAVTDRLVKEIEAMGLSCAKVDGSVTSNKRAQVFKDFMNAEAPHVIVCHPITTAFGVELGCADSITFFGPMMNGAFVYSQAKERLSSVHQKAEKTYIYHLSASQADRAGFSNIKQNMKEGMKVVDLLSAMVDT